MKKHNLILAATLLTGLTVFTSCEKEDDSRPTNAEKTIAEYVIGNPTFSTLAEALSKAGLVDALNGEGEFTVFAPSNAAFAALLNQLGAASLDDLPMETLTSVLLYHVIGEERKAASLSEGYYSTLSPAQNSYLSLNISMNNGVKINNSVKVLATDVDVKNGVIHFVDRVILPPTVVDHALANENFSILVEAVVKAGLVETLNGNIPFTIFAPTNQAFQVLFAQLGISGISDLTAEQLIPILTYHVVSGNVRSTDLSAGSVETLNGSINITLSPAPAINSSSNIVATDVQAANGVIHVIDEVLLPSE